jgi:hypothetical protein
MRQVLIVHFSQTGQLDRLAKSVCEPLQQCSDIQLDFLQLQPAQPYPFPWPFLGFFRIFPETVLMRPQPLLPLAVDASKRYDLVILAYQVWFLSPSQPMTAFLASPEAAQLLKGTPVVTLIGCRNMWLMAQEKVKNRLTELGARRAFWRRLCGYLPGGRSPMDGCRAQVSPRWKSLRPVVSAPL